MFKILFLLMALSSVAFAQDDQQYSYDPENGSDINELCAACHGEFGEGGGDGEYPRLAGLPAKYLIKQMHAFRSGQRSSIAMGMYATERELPGNDLQDIANYLAEKDLMTKMPVVDEDMPALEKLHIAQRVFNVARFDGDFSLGEKIYSGQCARCHGTDSSGKGSTPGLIGQYTDYLRLQIQSFQKGERKNKRMEKYIMSLSTDEIEALLSYLSVGDD